MEAENGSWDHKRQSNYVKNGIREQSYGFCQIHKYYHPEIVNNEKFFNDQEWQLQQCYKLYKGGTIFYGKNNIWKAKNNLTFI